MLDIGTDRHFSPFRGLETLGAVLTVERKKEPKKNENEIGL